MLTGLESFNVFERCLIVQNCPTHTPANTIDKYNNPLSFMSVLTVSITSSVTAFLNFALIDSTIFIIFSFCKHKRVRVLVRLRLLKLNYFLNLNEFINIFPNVDDTNPSVSNFHEFNAPHTVKQIGATIPNTEIPLDINRDLDSLLIS